MQIIDFIAGLRSKLAIITNKASLADLNKVEKIAKNVKSASLINKNVLIVTITLAVTEIKELKAQILKLKAELKDFKYVLRKDYKLLSNNRENRKLLYKEPNCKPMNK